ncbi:MAG: phosphatidylglycerophosphatase [Gammaproteobacteria bacterium SG8_31]|jgi:phosphatidylglycerophosphatase A|nr:MAG: phosphatidylglycerophosphatase [Gammaproteobacteria bacterium SG8_31]
MMTRGNSPTFANLLRRPVHLLAFGFGAGLSPTAPGTAGTLLAVPLVFLLRDLGAVEYLLLAAGLFVAGVWLCGRTARDLQVHDHPGIVWDEIVGYLVTMAWAPKQWNWIIGGFLLFRLFDIFKPWPIRTVDRRLRGGVGIMLDDLLAGLAAGLVLAGIEGLYSGGLGRDF